MGKMAFYYLVKILGLAPVTFKNGRLHPASLLGKLYPIALALTYAVIFPIAKFLDQEAPEYAKSLSLDWIVIAVQAFITYVALVSIPILLVSIGEKVSQVINDLCDMSAQLESLGIVEDLEEYWRNMLTSVITRSTLIGTLHVSLSIFYPRGPVIQRITWILRDLMNLGTVLIFSQILICIRDRFVLLTEKLISIFEDPAREGSSNLELLKDIKALHLRLCNLIDQTTGPFSAPIILCILQYTFLLIACSYWMLGGFIHPGNMQGNLVQFLGQRIFCGSVTTTLIIVQLFGLLHVCATTRDQGKEFGVTVFEVRNKFETPELKNVFFAFANQLVHKPITVSAFGFYDLDYTCLLQTFGAVIAYLLVMIQFEEE